MPFGLEATPWRRSSRWEMAGPVPDRILERAYKLGGAPALFGVALGIYVAWPGSFDELLAGAALGAAGLAAISVCLAVASPELGGLLGVNLEEAGLGPLQYSLHGKRCPHCGARVAPVAGKVARLTR